jgi:hypothetical protein
VVAGRDRAFRRPRPRGAHFRIGRSKKIADSLKRSAEQSHRRKAGAYQSAMTMLNFYINRAGKNLPKKQKHVLEAAKDELPKDFGREG